MTRRLYRDRGPGPINPVSRLKSLPGDCYASASPFARKALVVLHETGQIDDVELVTSNTSPASNASQMLIAHNPLDKIPALVCNDGPAIYDSRVICRYLDDRVWRKGRDSLDD